MSDVLRGNNLVCIRGDRPVFYDLDFDLSPGRALVLTGANGSGKSSLLKIIAGLLPAQKGTIYFESENILGDQDWISHNICYLAHKNSLKAEMTVAENLIFWAKMSYFDGNIREKATQVGIDHCLDLPVRFLSSGQARRAAMVRILCHPGKFWLLDEPTVGLDRDGVRLLAELMADHLTRGGRILAATHLELGLDPDRRTLLNMQDYAFTAQSLCEEDLLW